MTDSQIIATHIVKKFADAGYTAYFAGGWVRDYLMGHPSNDIDIATNAHPEKILDLFPSSLFVGIAFGVVIVVIEGMQFEVSTFRKDLVYEDGRRPIGIVMSNAEEDARRRDFTINGMFYDPLNHVIHDFVQGAEDLKKGIIRTIGNPFERFFEDRLRMIRAVRFASRFEFIIDIETQDAIKENAPLLFPSVAMERVWQEFNKMSDTHRFAFALIEMHRLGLLGTIFSDLEKTHLNDIKKRVSFFSHYPTQCPTMLYLLALFPDYSLQTRQDLCKYLTASNRDIKWVEFFTECERLVQQEANREPIEPMEWVYCYANPDWNICLEVISASFDEEEKKAFLHFHDKRYSHLKPHIDRIQNKKPLITGTFLHQQGIPSGKLMGTLLKEAERLAIHHDLETPEEILSKLKQTPIWPKEI